MLNKIYKNLKNNRNVFIVGPTNSGKTYFVLHELIPFLKKQGEKVQYFKDCNIFKNFIQKRIIIVDEVEVLLDREYLEKRHPEENPYYTKKYLSKVGKWYKKLEKNKNKVVYIVTRNDRKEIEYLHRKLKKDPFTGKKASFFLNTSA